MAEHDPSRARVIAAFAAIYLIWGSTYLGIRFAIETIPPFLMAGSRFVTAGALLYSAMRIRGAPRPRSRHWLNATVIGGFMLLGGNGGVVWAEQFVPSGLTALVVATVPLWVVLLLWITGREKPSGAVVAGVVIGLGGIALLVGPENLAGGGRIDPVGTAVVVLAALAWAAGSLYSREAQQAEPHLLATAASMLAGGALLLVASVIRGEVSGFHVAEVTVKSWLALGYLVVFGSWLALGAYMWLIRATTPARASTYAYVNPVVAVLLGWVLAGEPLNLRVVLATGVIVAAVALIVSEQDRVGTATASVRAAAPVTLDSGERRQ